jgi:hypothetical protein
MERGSSFNKRKNLPKLYLNKVDNLFEASLVWYLWLRLSLVELPMIRVGSLPNSEMLDEPEKKLPGTL